MDLVLPPPLARHRITLAQYDRMAESGVFEPDARVELIDGEVIDRAPIGPRHAAAVRYLTRALAGAAGEQAQVSPQNPLRLPPRSEPEPDVVLLRPREDFYARAHPHASDALLVIEVSDTTLSYDLGAKASLYAMHGIAHYWVIDLDGRRLHQHRDPLDGAYTEVVSLLAPGSVALPDLAGASVDLTALWRQG